MYEKICLTMCCLLFTAFTQAIPFDKDTFLTKDGHTLIIHFIKHGSLMLTYGQKIIQIDPVSTYADYSKLPKADVILITHEHGDHLDKKAIADSRKKGTVIIANEAVRRIIGEGVNMKNGDMYSAAKFMDIEAVPAYNTTPGRDKYHPKHRDNGYILNIGGLHVYVSGDTEDIPEMETFGKIDIAFLSANQPYTMTVSQLVCAAKKIKPRILYPYHYGETPVKEMKDQLSNLSGIEVRIREMQ